MRFCPRTKTSRRTRGELRPALDSVPCLSHLPEPVDSSAARPPARCTAPDIACAMVRPSSRRDHIESVVSEWLVGEQNQPKAVDQFVTGLDVVIHNAVSWNRSATVELPDLEDNLMGSLRLLETARLAGVRQFIFVSSVAVYHEIPPSAGGRITEETVNWPGSTYGAYKAGVESQLKAYHARYGLNTSAWRPAAVYGVDPNLRRSQWCDLIDAARRGETIDTPPRRQDHPRAGRRRRAHAGRR